MCIYILKEENSPHQKSPSNLYIKKSYHVEHTYICYIYISINFFWFVFSYRIQFKEKQGNRCWDTMGEGVGGGPVGVYYCNSGGGNQVSCFI